MAAVVRYCTLILYTTLHSCTNASTPLAWVWGRVHGSVSLKLKWILFILKTSSVLVSALTTPALCALRCSLHVSSDD